MPNRQLKSQRLYQQLADSVKSQIVKGELASGDQLPNEKDLSMQYGVSRTVVREAMKALAQEGLIEVQAGRGTFVAHQTLDAIKRSLGNLSMLQGDQFSGDLTEVRELLEPGITFLAAQRATPDSIALMEKAIETMEGALTNADVYIAADNVFHNALAEATGNDLIVSLLDPIIGLLLEQRRYVFKSKHGGPRAGQLFHKRILKAIKARDPEAARQAMLEHLQQVRGDSKAEEMPDRQKA
jgi:GntR family transcriptional repressor for pyruvate dehydrogenase complex